MNTITQSQKPGLAPEQIDTAPSKQVSAELTIGMVVNQICLDARHDSVKYILRSNTQHDGE